ncbi:hypothetical protein [Poritiphilus flavus]|uniref:hypothetical protein n=1 Tax=Poritiphilus flavus TaxID=2697053 RepID=UPI001EEC0ADE|nr:hypothetical protein [Poritiphilus flavus]
MIPAILNSTIPMVLQSKRIVVVNLSDLSGCRNDSVTIVIAIGQPNVPQMIFVLVDVIIAPTTIGVKIMV